MFRKFHIIIWLMALLSVWSCRHVFDNDFQGATVLSELSTSNDGDLISKLTTNWIPGHLFKDVIEDYVVFSQVGSLEIVYKDGKSTTGYINMTMVPNEYQDHIGPAPEKHYNVGIELNKLSFEQDEESYSITAKQIKTKIHFDSFDYCIGDRNTVPATVSVSGKLNAQERTTRSGRHLVGDVAVSVKLSSNEVISLKFTDLYFNMGIAYYY